MCILDIGVKKPFDNLGIYAHTIKKQPNTDPAMSMLAAPMIQILWAHDV